MPHAGMETRFCRNYRACPSLLLLARVSPISLPLPSRLQFGSLRQDAVACVGACCACSVPVVFYAQLTVRADTTPNTHYPRLPSSTLLLTRAFCLRDALHFTRAAGGIRRARGFLLVCLARLETILTRLYLYLVPPPS